MIKVQHNVPMPSWERHRRCKYPWDEMKVGDSFVFPKDIGRAAYAAAYSASRNSGKKFRVMKTDHGWQCWRVE